LKGTAPPRFGKVGLCVGSANPESRATVMTLGMGRDKGRRLLFHQMLLLL
jgi:hypothetical protein